jgi:hypothetical protein
VGECRQAICAAEIDWAFTLNGGKMPVDRESAGDPSGNLAVWRGSGKRLMCRVLKTGEAPGAGQKWGTNHWGTCVAATGWVLNPKHHRWELRAKAGQDPVTWLHVRAVSDAVKEEGWAQFAARLKGEYGVAVPDGMRDL